MNTRFSTARRAARRPVRARGFTLMEAAVTTAIVAVVAGATLDSLPQWRSRQRVTLAAAEFETDVQHARSLAVLHGKTVRLEFAATPAGSCYVIHSGPAGSCTCRADGQPVCHGRSEPLRTVGLGDGSGMTVAGNLRTLTFDPVAGTVSPAGTLRFTARDGAALHQVVNVMGRVRTCSPRGAVAGVRAC
jgi:type IV fimbrial biogenesis protein FimT